MQMLSNMRQIHLCFQQASLDGTTTGDKALGWPADAKLKSKADVKKMLSVGYLKAEDLEKLQLDKMTIGNVSEADPDDTILLEYKTANGKTTLVALKSGECRSLRTGQSLGNPPPRTPAFLE